MIPLFGDSEADGKCDVLEGRLISLALQMAVPLRQLRLARVWTNAGIRLHI
jgi:hypothetical protein